MSILWMVPYADCKKGSCVCHVHQESQLKFLLLTVLIPVGEWVIDLTKSTAATFPPSIIKGKTPQTEREVVYWTEEEMGFVYSDLMGANCPLTWLLCCCDTQNTTVGLLLPLLCGKYRVTMVLNCKSLKYLTVPIKEEALNQELS